MVTNTKFKFRAQRIPPKARALVLRMSFRECHSCRRYTHTHTMVPPTQSDDNCSSTAAAAPRTVCLPPKDLWGGIVRCVRNCKKHRKATSALANEALRHVKRRPGARSALPDVIVSLSRGGNTRINSVCRMRIGSLLSHSSC